MAAPLQAAYERLFNQTFTAVPKIWFFGKGDIVFRKSDRTGASQTWEKGAAKKYTVLDHKTKQFDSAPPTGVMKFADSTLNTEVAAAIGTQPASVLSGFFYKLQDNITGKISDDVHESDILAETDYETYLATQIAAFIA